MRGYCNLKRGCKTPAPFICSSRTVEVDGVFSPTGRAFAPVASYSACGTSCIDRPFYSNGKRACSSAWSRYTTFNTDCVPEKTSEVEQEQEQQEAVWANINDPAVAANFHGSLTRFGIAMETSISKIYSEFSFHFADIYQRFVQFYLWCLSRAGMYIVLYSTLEFTFSLYCYNRNRIYL